jgi:hypothetical protein
MSEISRDQKELAAMRVYHALKELNDALNDAQKIGLRADVSIDEFCTINTPWIKSISIQMLNPVNFNV